MKKKSVMKRIVLGVVIGILLMLALMFFLSSGPIELALNQRGFETASFTEIPKSEYDNNGSWWGYNQKKLAMLGNVVFSFDYDNANFVSGNPSLTNPYYCHLHVTVDETTTALDTVKAERPCNVVADESRNLVYYFAVEPTGENVGTNGNTGIARTMMHVYAYDPLLQTVVKVESTEVDPPSSIGKIRQSVDIDSSGNLGIAYGQYDGWITVKTYDVGTGTWGVHQTLSNLEGDSLMYCYIEMADLATFYVLCVHDTWREDATYYQYVKLFVYEQGVWSDHMIVDYRDDPLASKESQIVEHTECKLVGDELHLITRSLRLQEVRHFVYKDGVLEEQHNPLNMGYVWVRLLEIEGTLYYVSTNHFPFPTLEIREVETEKVVYRTLGIPRGSYLYLGEPTATGKVVLLFYPGWGDVSAIKAKRVTITIN